MFAIVTASTPANVPELEIKEKKVIRTPYGDPSSPIVIGSIGSQEIAFISRNGPNMEIVPHEVNFRANIWALHSIGVSAVIALAGAMAVSDDVEVGSIIMPKDVIDYTYGRPGTFAGTEGRGVVYTDLSEPFDAAMRQVIAAMAHGRGYHMRDDVVAGCIQGPRLPSEAEARRYRRDGCQVVGMASMPEAALCSELSLPYVLLCSVVGRVGDATAPDFRNYHNHDTFRVMRQLLSGL